MTNNIKVQLDLTQEQFSVLFDLIFSKYSELDKREDALLALEDYALDWGAITKYEEQLKEIEVPLANFQTIYEQLLNY